MQTTRRGPAQVRRAGVAEGGVRRPAARLLAWWAVLLVVMLALGWLASRVVTRSELGHAETEVSTELASDRTPAWNDATRILTLFGDTLPVILVGLVAATVARVVLHRWREPALIAAALLGEVTIFLLVTLLIERNRPPVPKLDDSPPTSSFPSGHTAAALVLYGSLAVIAWSRLRSVPARALAAVLAVALPLLVGAARVYRGMHFVTDVLGGLVLGAAWLAAAVHGVGRAAPSTDPPRARGAA